MAYSQKLVDSLQALFKTLGFQPRFEEKNGFALFTLQMKLHCKLQSARMYVFVQEDHFSTVTTVPLSADKNCRLAVAEYLTRANFNMRNGNFELNMEDGEIRFKTYLHASNGEMDIAGARLCLILPFLMIDRFGDGLVEVLFGFKSPREAFEDVRSK